MTRLERRGFAVALTFLGAQVAMCAACFVIGHATRQPVPAPVRIVEFSYRASSAPHRLRRAILPPAGPPLAWIARDAGLKVKDLKRARDMALRWDR